MSIFNKQKPESKLEKQLMDHLVEHENNTEHVYRGKNKDLTIGVGIHIKKAEDLVGTGATVLDPKTNKKVIITDDNLDIVEKELNKVRDHEPNKNNLKAGAFRTASTIELDKEIGRKWGLKKAREFEDELKKAPEIDYQSMPDGVKIMTLDTAFANSVRGVEVIRDKDGKPVKDENGEVKTRGKGILNGGFPNMAQALKNKDYVRAAYESRYGVKDGDGQFTYNQDRFADNFKKGVQHTGESGDAHLAHYFRWKGEGAPKGVTREHLKFDDKGGQSTIPPEFTWDNIYGDGTPNSVPKETRKQLEKFFPQKPQHTPLPEEAKTDPEAELEARYGKLPSSRYVGVFDRETGELLEHPKAKELDKDGAVLTDEEKADREELFAINLGLGQGRFPKESDENEFDTGFTFNKRLVREFGYIRDKLGKASRTVLLPPVDPDFKPKRQPALPVPRNRLEAALAGMQGFAKTISKTQKGTDFNPDANKADSLLKPQGALSKLDALSDLAKNFNPLGTDVPEFEAEEASTLFDEHYGKKASQGMRDTLTNRQSPFRGRALKNRQRLRQMADRRPEANLGHGRI